MTRLFALFVTCTCCVASCYAQQKDLRLRYEPSKVDSIKGAFIDSALNRVATFSKLSKSKRGWRQQTIWTDTVTYVIKYFNDVRTGIYNEKGAVVVTFEAGSIKMAGNISYKRDEYSYLRWSYRRNDGTESLICSRYSEDETKFLRLQPLTADTQLIQLVGIMDGEVNIKENKGDGKRAAAIVASVLLGAYFIVRLL